MTCSVQAVAMGHISVWDWLVLPITTKHANAGLYNSFKSPPAGLVCTSSALCFVLLGVLHFLCRSLLCKVLLAFVRCDACGVHLMNL